MCCRRLLESLCSLWILLFLCSAAGAQQSDPEAWTEALSRIYPHGISLEIAQNEIGVAGVPFLIQELSNPDSRDRANTVAFLGWLGDGNAVDALLSFLEEPPASLERPGEDKAALISLHALGDIARRGESGARKARRALLRLTAHAKGGGDLLRKAGARRSSNGLLYRDDLLTQAVFGLARSGRSSAKKRLQSIASGEAIPARGGRDQRGNASAALKRFDTLFSKQARNRIAQQKKGNSPPRQRSSSEPALDADGGAGAGPVARTLDSGTFHSLGLTFANHVDHTSPITDARVDQILATISQRIQLEDFSSDTACCLAMIRKGNANTFGTPGDGYDVLDTSSKTSAVMNNSTAHVKVVRAISACGSSTNTNIIGCGWIGAQGFVVERYGNDAQEGALWAHENGHNAGINHNNNNADWIMYGSLGSNNRALLSAECNSFHSTNTAGEKTSVGPCCAGTGRVELCAAGCGNNFQESGEACDGSDLGGATCQNEGFSGGTLGCNPDCTLDTGSCTICGDGVIDPGEECDGSDLGGAACGDLSCSAGTPSCTSSCTVSYGSCTGCPICDFDGICDADENCDECSDCLKTDGTPACGNGLCEAHAGENCSNCPADCAGKQNGKPSRRFCCGNGGGENPVGCGDSRCNEGGNACANSNLPGTCCNDNACEGTEDSFNCEVDCGPPPSCKTRGEACSDASECCSGSCGGSPKRGRSCK